MHAHNRRRMLSMIGRGSIPFLMGAAYDLVIVPYGVQDINKYGGMQRACGGKEAVSSVY